MSACWPNTLFAKPVVLEEKAIYPTAVLFAPALLGLAIVVFARPTPVPMKTLSPPPPGSPLTPAPKPPDPPPRISKANVPSLLRMFWAALEKVICLTERLVIVPVQLASGVKVSLPVPAVVITWVSAVMRSEERRVGQEG